MAAEYIEGQPRSRPDSASFLRFTSSRLGFGWAAQIFTLSDRDSMQQKRIHEAELFALLEEKVY